MTDYFHYSLNHSSLLQIEIITLWILEPSLTALRPASSNLLDIDKCMTIILIFFQTFRNNFRLKGCKPRKSVGNLYVFKYTYITHRRLYLVNETRFFQPFKTL
jgi:hypothetical protein